MSCVYIDITDLLDYCRDNSSLSGIQRVTIRLIGALRQHYGDSRVRLIGVHPLAGKVCQFEGKFLSADYDYDDRAFCEELIFNINLTDYLDKKYRSRFRKLAHGARLQLLNTFSGGTTFKKRHINRSRRALIKPDLKSGDVLFLPGLLWHFPDYLDYVGTQKAAGVKVISLVHDLIPLITPQYTIDGIPDYFHACITKLVDASTVLIANSNATARDLQWFIDKTKATAPPVTVVPLAHEFILGRPPQASEKRTALLKDTSIYPDGVKISHEVVETASRPYVLCVGTIEPRKNIWQLCNVWKELLDNIGPSIPRLVFAGKFGWGNGDFQDFVNGTGWLNGYIRACERPSDHELAYLYRKCEFTVFPSFYEGWGLPIGESLWFGKFAVASKTSSMPEVGGVMADYVDPNCLQSIYDGVRRAVTDKTYLRMRESSIDRTKLRTWADVAYDLAVQITAVMEETPESVPVPRRLAA